MTTVAMTVQEVAEYLNVDPKTVYRLVNRGELPGFKVGGSWRFQKDDLDAWIAKAQGEGHQQAQGRRRMSLSLKDAARQVLANADEPPHYQEITKRILDGHLANSKSKTADASLNAVLAVDIKRNGTASSFVCVTPGVFGLRGEGAPRSTVEEASDGVERRVPVPHFPPYDEVRRVLRVWDGMPRAHVTGLRSTISMLRGTPQAPVGWSSPDATIADQFGLANTLVLG